MTLRDYIVVYVWVSSDILALRTIWLEFDQQRDSRIILNRSTSSTTQFQVLYVPLEIQTRSDLRNDHRLLVKLTNNRHAKL